MKILLQREQILAGAKYLGYIDRQFPEEIADSAERVKFVLAAYNSGYAHIFDARRLATNMEKTQMFGMIILIFSYSISLITFTTATQ